MASISAEIMKILLTGPTGFVGSNYLQFTANANIECLYKSRSANAKNGFIGDLNETRTLDRIVEGNYDFIIHAAWIGLPDLNSHNNQVNLNMYKTTIDRLKNYENTNHIFLGTCLEYGQLNGSVKETDTGVELNDFAKTKLQILDYARNSGINFTWLRLFYTFGKNQHSNSLFNYLINCIKNGTEINIQNPTTKHDYIYIKNIISAIDQIILNDAKIDILNLGQGESLSNGKLADIFLEHFNKDKKYSLSIDENSGLFANIEKARMEINWKPRYSVKDAVLELIRESQING